MHAYIKSSEFIGGKGPRPLKKLSFCQIKGEVSILTLHNYKLTHVFIKVAIGNEYVMLSW